MADAPPTFADSAAPERPRIGLPADPFFASAAPAVQGNLTAVATGLAAAGAEVEEQHLDVDLAAFHAAHRVITFTECAAHRRRRYRTHADRYGPKARELIDRGLATTTGDYLSAQWVRTGTMALLSRALARADAFLMPVASSPAPDRKTTGDSAFQIPWTRRDGAPAPTS